MRGLSKLNGMKTFSISLSKLIRDFSKGLRKSTHQL